MNPIFAGMAVQAVGKLVGGGQQQKYAKRYRAEAQAAAEEAIRAVQREKQEVKDIRAEDEARLKAATGYDLVKLRDDAIKAGFNPLTVLGATGGAGYDGRGAVLTTPFVSSEGAYARGLDANIATGQAVIGGAGYVGDAISGIGDGLVGYGEQQQQMRHEAMMLETALRGNTSSPGAVAGSRVSGGRSGGSAPLVGATSIKPMSRPGDETFQRVIPVYDPQGNRFQIDATWARRNGFEPEDWLQPGDYENWLGESGQAASLGHASVFYPEIVGNASGWSWGEGVPVPSGHVRFSPRTNATRPAAGWFGATPPATPGAVAPVLRSPFAGASRPVMQ